MSRIVKFLSMTLVVGAMTGSAQAAENPSAYFRAEDEDAYMRCVNSITNMQQNGELYGLSWDKDADYYMDRVLESGLTDGMSVMGWLCTNVLDKAPRPTVAGFPGCTAFMATNAVGERLVGRNCDYPLPMAHALLYIPKNEALQRKYSSVATVDGGWLGYDVGELDDGKTDLSYAALFPYYCMDGMNDAGLMISILAVDARERPSTGKKDWMIEQFHANRTNIVLSVAIRYLLDNASSAEEAVGLLGKFNVFAAIGGGLGLVSNYHLYLCDKSGKALAVEWMPPSQEGGSWELRVVEDAAVISNFCMDDGYGHGSNRWEIARRALAIQQDHLEDEDAMNLCRAVSQRKSEEATSWTHWSVVYNLDKCSANIATLGNYDEIFPYAFNDSVGLTIGEPKSARPVVETDLPVFAAATAESGKVYLLADPISGSSGAPSSYAGASVAAVNRMGLTYDAGSDIIHAVATNDNNSTCPAVFYVDMSLKDPGKAAYSIVAGVNKHGLAGRVVKFKNSTVTGDYSPSEKLRAVLSNCRTFVSALEMMGKRKQSAGGSGFILSDAMGNVAVWGPEGAELCEDDASEMMRNSLDLRKGIYAADGDGRGQFDELPGLMRLAATDKTRAIVSMGYGHLDVMLPGTNRIWRVEVPYTDVPVYGIIAEPPAVAHATATLTYVAGFAVERNNRGQLVALTNAKLMVVYTADSDYRFADGAKSWTNEFSVCDTVTTPPAPETALFRPRKPDYAEASGKDWLYNHAIAGRECPDEAAADSGVDLFYVYPTLNDAEVMTVIDGFRDIDDATMRSATTNNLYQTAVTAFVDTGRCFADMTHVYAPFYRQATVTKAIDCATNGFGVAAADANARYLKCLSGGPAYADVTNALTVYFAKWNNGRKLVLAAHSQGSALLRLVMRDYFTLPENQDKAKQIVCSYQIGFGVSKAEVDNITKVTGIKFAEKANDINVIVSYNTVGEDSYGNSLLLPPDTIAINPLSWSRETDLANKDLNLGARTSELGTADVIVSHLYGAQLVDSGHNRGEVVVCKELNDQVLKPNIMGACSLHAYDYSAYWANLRDNAFTRYAAFAGLVEVVTNGLPAVADATWEVKVQGQGQERTEAFLSPVDGKFYAATDAQEVKLVYTLDAAKAAEGYYFADGTTEISFPMKQDGGVWVSTVTAAELAAATKVGKPNVQLGVVAQRYPWNGIVDVNYRAACWPKSGVAFGAVVTEVGETVVTNSIGAIANGVGQAELDLKAIAPETAGEARFSIVAEKTPSWPVDVQTKVAGEGTVSGGKQCPWGSQTTLTAEPAPGFSFIRWSDGDATNPRTVTVDGTAYTAEFGLLTAAKFGAKADGYPYFDQTFTFKTNGLIDSSSKYWNWAANFYVTFSKKIPANTLKLATRYPNMPEEWNQSIKGDDLESGVEYSISDAGSFSSLCGQKQLDFALWAYDNQNLDAKMTIWFKLTKGTEQITQKLAEYTFEELVKVVIPPSGETEPVAPYAIKTGDNYYMITNHSWDLLIPQAKSIFPTSITMSGLKGNETVQLYYLINFVSNANEKTTFLAMSYPRKNTKGGYRYLPMVIPGSMEVLKGYDPITKVFNTALNLSVGEREWAITNFTGDIGVTKPGAVKVSGTGGSQNVALTSVTIDDDYVTFVATGAVASVIAEPTGMTLSGVGLVNFWERPKMVPAPTAEDSAEQPARKTLSRVGSGEILQPLKLGEITTKHILGYSNVTFTVRSVAVSTDSQTATYTAKAGRQDRVDEMPLGDLVKHWVGLPPPPTEDYGDLVMGVFKPDIGLSYVVMRTPGLGVDEDWATVSQFESRADVDEMHYIDALGNKNGLRPQAFYKYQVAK